MLKVKQLGWLVSCAAVMACGSDDPAGEGPVTCTAPAGNYVVNYWPGSGSCGIPEPQPAPDGRPPIVDCAEASEQWSDDHCTATYHGRCAATAPLVDVVVDMTLTWEADGFSASGTADLTGYLGDGTKGCEGTLDVTVARY